MLGFRACALSCAKCASCSPHDTAPRLAKRCCPPCCCACAFRFYVLRSIKHIIYGLWRLFLLPESGVFLPHYLWHGCHLAGPWRLRGCHRRMGRSLARGVPAIDSCSQLLLLFLLPSAEGVPTRAALNMRQLPCLPYAEDSLNTAAGSLMHSDRSGFERAVEEAVHSGATIEGAGGSCLLTSLNSVQRSGGCLPCGERAGQRRQH